MFDKRFLSKAELEVTLINLNFKVAFSSRKILLNVPNAI